MDKPILTHTITANSFEELENILHDWMKKMQGKIEILEMNEAFEVKGSDLERRYPNSLKITYYYLDNRQVEFTLEELMYIAEHFHDVLKDQPDNKVLQAIEEKAEKALGWK
jgi:hypothetical protein